LLGILALFFGTIIGAGIEIAQLFQRHHSPEITDALVYAVGVAAGMWVRCVWLNADRFSESSRRFRWSEGQSWAKIVQTAVAVFLAAAVLAALGVLLFRQ
jgi:hypothetical protein